MQMIKRYLQGEIYKQADGDELGFAGDLSQELTFREVFKMLSKRFLLFPTSDLYEKY